MALHVAWAPACLFFVRPRKPQLDQDSPPTSSPLSSPHFTSSPTHIPMYRTRLPRSKNDTTHRCCPLPAAHCPPKVPTHTRLIAPASAFPPTPHHQPSCSIVEHSRADALVSTSAPPAQQQQHSAPSGPSAALASRQASRSTATRTTLPVCSIVCSSMGDGPFTDLSSHRPDRPADWLSDWPID